MANVSSSNGLEKRPKLRFPGFDEPWRAERLSDFADRVTRKNSKNETDLPLTISSKDGLVDQVSYFNKTVAIVISEFRCIIKISHSQNRISWDNLCNT